MVSTIEILVGLTSTITRLSAFSFLRWIPGHHFPPVIVTSTVLYLTLILTNSASFGTGRPSLREAFPKLFQREDQDEDDQKKTGQEDHDEPSVYDDESIVLKTLVFGIPNWQEWEFSYVTIGMNLLVTLLALDLVFRGSIFHSGKDLQFTRLGYVDDTSAKVLLREPHLAELPIYAYVKETTGKSWTTVDKIYHLGEETDYTYPLVFEKLRPDTSYTYSLSNKLGGTFTTAPAPQSSKASSLTFLTSSCIKANFPYNPFAHSLSISGFKYLSRVLRSLPTPASFMLFLGDFIYVDVPLRISSTQEHYRAEYRRVYASPSWKLPGVGLPWIHTLDDHEIANDWAGGNETEPFPAASDPFIHYHVSVNPPLPPGSAQGSEANTTYFQFTQGPASFFMMDTRRYRTRPEGFKVKSNSLQSLYGNSSGTDQNAEHSPSMLGPVQLQALMTFLTKPETANVHWKIIATSVPFTKNWRFGTADTWGGFLSERSRILEAMHFAEENLGVRVIILSGDRHEFAAIRYPPRNTTAAAREGAQYDSSPGAGPHEFSVGPLSMFYLPFRTFKQVDDEDVALAYLPHGNSKLGAISILPIGGALKSKLIYTLYINGEVAWKHELTSPSPSAKRRSNVDTWKLAWLL